jgi:hypothetical protein
LEHLWRSGKTEHRVAMRARAILLAANGWPNDAIARYLGRHHTRVRKWRRPFARDRLAGLQDPFMTLSCPALSVVAEPKLTDRGLVNPAWGEIVPLFVD